jgi:hypothetical protein
VSTHLRLSNQFGYGVIALGVVLSFLSAVVPFFTAGHQLLFGVFLAGVTPYLAYVLVVALLRRPVTNVAGAILVLFHGWLVISERYVGGADFSDRSIYYVPLIFTVLLIPLVVRALREPWHD